MRSSRSVRATCRASTVPISGPPACISSRAHAMTHPDMRRSLIVAHALYIERRCDGAWPAAHHLADGRSNSFEEYHPGRSGGGGPRCSFFYEVEEVCDNFACFVRMVDQFSSAPSIHGTGRCSRTTEGFVHHICRHVWYPMLILTQHEVSEKHERSSNQWLASCVPRHHICFCLPGPF